MWVQLSRWPSYISSQSSRQQARAPCFICSTPAAWLPSLSLGLSLTLPRSLVTKWRRGCTAVDLWEASGTTDGSLLSSLRNTDFPVLLPGLDLLFLSLLPQPFKCGCFQTSFLGPLVSSCTSPGRSSPHLPVNHHLSTSSSLVCVRNHALCPTCTFSPWVHLNVRMAHAERQPFSHQTRFSLILSPPRCPGAERGDITDYSLYQQNFI